MVLEVADDPDSAMNEKQNAWLACSLLLWRHDVKLYSTSILRARFFDGGYTGHVDRALILQRSKNLLRFGLRQFPKRTAILVEFRQKRPCLIYSCRPNINIFTVGRLRMPPPCQRKRELFSVGLAINRFDYRECSSNGSPRLKITNRSISLLRESSLRDAVRATQSASIC